MKKLQIAIGCLLLTAGLTFGQSQTLSFSDGSGDPVSGTYSSTDAFSLTTTATFSGYSSSGLSYWIEVPTALAPYIKITNVGYGTTFQDPNQGFAGSTNLAFSDSNSIDGARSGYTLETRDLGSTSDDGSGNPVPIAGGSYLVSNLQFSLTGAPAGTYVLHETINPSRASEMTQMTGTGPNATFSAHPFPDTSYTITIVPEPATWSLLGLGGLGAFGLTALRARRS